MDELIEIFGVTLATNYELIDWVIELYQEMEDDGKAIQLLGLKLDMLEYEY